MAALQADTPGAAIHIGDDTHQVVVEGVDIRGYGAGNAYSFGIMIRGERIREVLIRNNRIHHFDSDADAHAIAVFGTGETESDGIRDVVIDGNTVHDMRTGSSESIAVNGNVRRWVISSNTLRDINNIAIDAIGGEGTSPSRTNHSGRILPGIRDTARFGFIEGNVVENLSTVGNMAYGGEESWAAAIYIDGGRHVSIVDNIVRNAPWAFEVGAENCVESQHITIRGNAASGSHYGDLLIGGYAPGGFRENREIDCNPLQTLDANEGHGYVRHVTTGNNDFLSSDTLLSPVTLQFRTTHSIVAEPGVSPHNASGDGSAAGDDNAIRTSGTICQVPDC
ncbi:MAG: hypothetical protein CSB44_00980 [Gammaproteobacteria bacterium]|nr:MAG: hypothetical protein CSB44_00980 [Gammaproteobacteria bacterium]